MKKAMYNFKNKVAIVDRHYKIKKSNMPIMDDYNLSCVLVNDIDGEQPVEVVYQSNVQALKH